MPESWQDQHFSKLIDISRPVIEELSAEEIMATQRRLWICKIKNGPSLRGGWEKFGDFYFFLATIWAPRIDDIQSIGLKLEDFPLHESSADHLLLIQQQEASMRELTQLGARLREEKNRAESASKAKTTFLATMSHEIRTPMNGILGMAQLLMDQNLTSEQAELVETIDMSAQHLLHIVNDVLDFAKLEAGRMEVRAKSVDIATLVEDAISTSGPPANQKGIHLLTDNSINAGQHYQLDPSRIRQVLVNLLSNAIKFTDKEGSITVTISEQNNLLRIAVSDTGVGMLEEEAQQMFRPFVQAESGMDRGEEGTGLGLAICAKIIEACNGTIAVDSTLGQGSTFWFEIPVQKVAAPTPKTKAQRPGRVLTGRVLLVEDNPVNQRIAQAFLSKIGLKIETVSNGQQAVEQVQQQSFDLILMDCHMPIMDGYQATKSIRNLGIKTPIIALTADVLEESQDACLEAGMNDVLTKPIRREQFHLAMSQWFPAQN